MRTTSIGFLVVLLSVLSSTILVLAIGFSSFGTNFAFESLHDAANYAKFTAELRLFGLALLFSLLGIVCKMTLDAWRGQTGKGLARDLISAVLIVPLVLAGTFESLSSMTGYVLPALFCFQNGFFWVSLLRSELS